jgi:putative hydrolase of the HAD superfamily
MQEWLVVDLGGVATHFRPERRLDALVTESGLPPDVIEERLFTSGLDHSAELGHHTTESITTAIIEHLDHRVALHTLVAAWSQAFEPNYELLEAISHTTRRRALFTNNGPMLDLCLAGPLAQLAAPFDAIVCSWHIGATKPSPQAFDRAAERLEVGPASLLLIDDTPANADAARSAGWRALVHTSVTQTVALLRLGIDNAR